MNIGIDARMFGPHCGGIGRYTQELVTGLITNNTGDAFTLFVKPGTHIPAHNENVRVIETPIHWYTLQEQIQFPRLLNRYPVDLMHFPHWNVPLAYRKPFVVTIHDLLLRQYPSREASTLNAPLYYLKHAAYRAVIKHAIHASRHIFTVSAFSKNDIVKTYDVLPEKITTLHLGVSAALQQHIHTTTPSVHSYFLYVGVQYPHKNLFFLCAIFMSFAATQNEFLTLVLAGPDGPCTKTLQNYIKTCNAHATKGAILFIKNPTDTTLAALYKNARCFVFPSLYEGFGLPPIEAQVFGVPVIASNTTAMPDILEKSALLVAPHDIGAWHHAFHTILNDTIAVQKLIQSGFENAKQYSWDTLTSSTYALYNKIVQKEV